MCFVGLSHDYLDIWQEREQPNNLTMLPGCTLNVSRVSSGFSLRGVAKNACDTSTASIWTHILLRKEVLHHLGCFEWDKFHLETWCRTSEELTVAPYLNNARYFATIFGWANEGHCITLGSSPTGAANAMDIVLRVVRLCNKQLRSVGEKSVQINPPKMNPNQITTITSQKIH